MPDQRILLSTDRMFRRLDPGLWNRDTNTVFASAFMDDDHPNYDGLSFFLKRHYRSNAAASFLRSQKRNISRQTGVSVGELTVERIYDLGYGVAELDTALIGRFKLSTKLDDFGQPYNANGHIDVLNGRSKAIDFSNNCKVLTREEILSG